ncbi:accessory gene regulator ArgB-like protein [Anaerovorax odorimutans]|uniref:accessory gene regulator ArgB-like protein n=1 Tax=Anaerovorax odorimutans TaxID=109327 RepID=UPI003B500454
MKKGFQEKIVSVLNAQLALTHTDTLKVRYALELLRNEGLKTLILLFVFSFAGFFKEFILCMAIACTVRVFAGGMHMKTNIGCFTLSFIFLYAEIILLPRLAAFPDSVYQVLLLISVLIICGLSPLASYKRPFQGQKRYKLCKKNAILFSLLWCVCLLFFVPDTYLRNCGIWFFNLQAVQMVMTYFYRKVNEERRNSNV